MGCRLDVRKVPWGRGVPVVILSQRFCVYLSDEHEGKTIPQTEKKPTREEGVGWPGWRGEPAHKAGVLYVLCFVLNFVFLRSPRRWLQLSWGSLCSAEVSGTWCDIPGAPCSLGQPVPWGVDFMTPGTAFRGSHSMAPS